MKKQKIIDAILFFNELDLLELRFEELYEHVDHFLIVESTKTFTNKKKPLYFHENKERFKRWEDKIVHYVVNDMPDDVSEEELVKLIKNDSIRTNNFLREIHQRNSIGTALKEIRPDYEDIIIVSDVDEFPNPNKFKTLNNDLPFGPVIFKQKWFVWNVNLEKMHHWMGSTAFYYSHYISKKSIFQDMRDKRWDENSPEFYVMENGGWHFSWFGDYDFIRDKIYAFAHDELATDFWLNDENIQSLIDDGYASNGLEKNGVTGKLKKADISNIDLPKVWYKFKDKGIEMKKPKIYDCFLFDHELDMLNLRLHEMDEYVDRFILIESRQSHTGIEKKLHFQDHRELFKKFLPKIEHMVIDLPDEVLYEPHPPTDDDKEKLNRFRENYNRNAIKTILERINPDDDDIILISDVDELWDDDILRRLKYNEVEFDTFKTIKQRWHYWDFKWDFENMTWPGPAFCRWSYLKTTTPQEIRNVRYESETHLNDINGWHLSWFGTVENNYYKLMNTHHQELNVYKKEEVEKMMNEGYLFDGTKMVQLNWNYYPRYRHILEEGELYKKIFK